MKSVPSSLLKHWNPYTCFKSAQTPAGVWRAHLPGWCQYRAWAFSTTKNQPCCHGRQSRSGEPVNSAYLDSSETVWTSFIIVSTHTLNFKIVFCQFKIPVSVNRSGRMNLFSLMQSISEMDDVNKELVIHSSYNVAVTQGLIPWACAHITFIVTLKVSWQSKALSRTT